MKILTISNSPLVESQGSGYVIINFCHRLRDRGHQVDLYGPEYYEPLKFLKGKAKRHRQTLGILFLALNKLLKEKYDVVEFYGVESWLATSLFFHFAQRNYLLVSHSNGLETHSDELSIKYLNSSALDGSAQKWYQYNQSKIFKKAFTKVDGIVTVSQDDANYASKHKYQPDHQIVAIDNSLPDAFLNLKINFKREPVIGFCGSWLLRKGTNVIKSDVTQLLIDFPSCSFKLIGVGTFCKEDHFPATVCSQIEVIPFVENKAELLKIYQSLSILLVPSIYESFGLVVAEAMACGCAVVSSKTGFAATLKDHEEVILIEEPISPYLYKEVSKLLLNEPLRLQVAQAGYQRVQNLRWELAVEQLENTYFKWLEELRQKK